MITKMNIKEFNTKYKYSEYLTNVAQEFTISDINEILAEYPPSGDITETNYENTESTYYLEERETGNILIESNTYTSIQHYISNVLKIKLVE